MFLSHGLLHAKAVTHILHSVVFRLFPNLWLCRCLAKNRGTTYKQQTSRRATNKYGAQFSDLYFLLITQDRVTYLSAWSSVMACVVNSGAYFIVFWYIFFSVYDKFHRS